MRNRHKGTSQMPFDALQYIHTHRGLMTSKNKTKYGVGIFEYLTIIFVILKLTGTIDWTWLQVFSPSIIAFSDGVIEGIIESIENDIQKTKRTPND